MADEAQPKPSRDESKLQPSDPVDGQERLAVPEAGGGDYKAEYR